MLPRRLQDGACAHIDNDGGSPNLRLFDIKYAWSWIDPDEMEQWLWAQPASINFGDIYARLGSTA